MSRVLLHSLVFSPDGVSTAYLMTELAHELQRLGHAVTVLSTTPHYNVDEQAISRQPMRKRWGGLLYHSECGGIPVWHIRLPLKGHRVWLRAADYIRFHLLSLVACLKTIGRQDIVISTSPPLTIGIISWLLGVRWNVKSVYKVAEVYPDLAIRQGVVKHPGFIAILRCVERIVYSRNAMIVPIARQFKEVIQKRGVPEQKLVLIPDFVDLEFYRPLPRANPFAEKWHLLGDFVVLYGGNIGHVQDWESVLFAAEKLSNLPIKFVIVGDGARRDWLANEVKRRSLPNMNLLGYQPREIMPYVNASCDVGTIPMTRTGATDGFPSKIYSNLASGKPVIVSAFPLSEMAEIVMTAGCGRVVIPEDPQAYVNAVLSAFREREFLPGEGERGRKFVEMHYSKQAIAGKYSRLISSLT